MWLLMPVPIFVAVTAVLVGVLVGGRRLFPGTFTAKRAFRCPFRDTNVNVDFKEAETPTWTSNSRKPCGTVTSWT
ncbi:MAG: hypothetical protein HW381_1607 [Candidatus Rokubacteria bacterium]|nr:hypothetical protein [Candidatus Rokubacteria bacterium]